MESGKRAVEGWKGQWKRHPYSCYTCAPSPAPAPAGQADFDSQMLISVIPLPSAF